MSGKKEKELEAMSSEQAPFCVRHSVWQRYSSAPCHGSFRRDICNFGVLDLPRIASDVHCLFLNKFDLALDAAAVRCWHQLVTPTAYLSHDGAQGVTSWQRLATRT